MKTRLTRAALVVLALLSLMSGALADVAQAQEDTQPLGWVSMSGPGGTWATAEEACRAQWNKFANGGYDRFVGAIPYEDDWRFQDCEWTRYQWLCPQENPGAGFACGTIIPSYARSAARAATRSL